MARGAARRALIRRCLALAVAGLVVLGLGILGGGRTGPSVALAVLSGPQLVGGFEIDGDFPSGSQGLGGSDWANATDIGPGLVSGPIVIDPLGHADTTNFSQGAKESQDPDTWHAQAGTAPPKADIGNVYAADRLFGGHRWAYLGFERAKADGTVFYDVELDQRANHPNSHGVSVPSRSPGDVLFVIQQHGNGPFTFGATKQTWSCTSVATCNATGAWGSATDAGSDFYGLANAVAIAKGPWTDAIAESGLIGVDQFAEMAIDLTALGVVPGCPSAGFVTLNVRSVASDAHSGQKPELKDYAVAPTSIPSSCVIPAVPTPTPTAAATATATPSPAPKHTPKPSHSPKPPLPDTQGSPSSGKPSPHPLPATATLPAGSDGTGGEPILPLVLLGLSGLAVAVVRLKPQRPRSD